MLALDSWADVANITFSLKSSLSGRANLDFGNFNRVKGQAFAYLPNSGALPANAGLMYRTIQKIYIQLMAIMADILMFMRLVMP
ncbi:hypothetical protein [Arsenophonus apicola]|uniref:hypothetical protein n=1 Tax=Arsenophonus apicola TaxID=2879119 RepID=UPI003879B722